MSSFEMMGNCSMQGKGGSNLTIKYRMMRKAGASQTKVCTQKGSLPKPQNHSKKSKAVENEALYNSKVAFVSGALEILDVDPEGEGEVMLKEKSLFTNFSNEDIAVQCWQNFRD